jgi:glycosyltransferase involved in cell wall biosynthesis
MIYNPSGEKLRPRVINKIETIGIVSMLAPWKGIHQILLWASLYEEKLKKIGIKEINIYGADIYKTKGSHQNYATQLIKLKQNFPCSLINFKGNISPSIIYNTIDLLIHPVISPEPFGRILIEAFTTKIPVLSTALGGSGELAINEETAIVFSCYDYQGLFDNVKQISQNETLRNHLINNAFKKAQEIKQQVETINQKL